jgi:carboxyl-terminal processing protease
MNSDKDTENRTNLVRKVVFFALTILVLYFVFAFGYITGQKGISIGIGPKQVVNTEAGKPQNIDFSLFWEAWNKLKDKSALNPDSQKMIFGSISGMLSSVNDPYTVFFTPDENKRFKEDIQGEFDGIGIEIVSKNNLPTVVAPLSGTPAEKAGLKPNDVIIEVDGTKTSDISFNETVDKIRGKKGTKVTLKISREGTTDPITVEVERDTIIVKSVEWETKNIDGKKYAYVKIRQFGDDTNSLFEQFVNETVANKPDGIVIDLRNNPGGYLQSAIEEASYFLDGGIVVKEQGKDGETKEYKVTKKARLKDFKTVVLVNSGSASASEIFAGALQDRKEGELIGEKTFGKGSVQELVDLSDGSAVKITVAKWLTPNGRMINGEGIKPDIDLKKDDNSDNQLERAFEYLKTGK